MTDPIADMLTRIRNAIAAKHSRVDIPASKLKLEIARILKEEGYVNNFVVKGESLKKTIRIFLRYDARGTSSIRSRAHSRPRVHGGRCDATLATTKRIARRRREDAWRSRRRENMGGELLAQIY